MMKMKIAYLILAHDQPRHFQRLINALNSDNVYFYVHVDLKSNILEFDCFKNVDNISFIKRISVNHGGFSLTQAMIHLIQAASESNEFDYFIFLSGKDYPIKCNNFIFDFLKDCYPKNFIDFYHLNEQDPQFFVTISKYHFVDLIGCSPQVFKLPLRIAQFALKKLLPRRSFVKGMLPYRGSQWTCLNRPSVDYVIDFLNSPKAKNYINFFKYVWGSDEIFFHTLLLNSPHAVDCYHDDNEIKKSRKRLSKNKYSVGAKLHHIDWSVDREDPAVFDIGDFSALQESDALFARKFSESKSEELLDCIDELLLSATKSTRA